MRLPSSRHLFARRLSALALSATLVSSLVPTAAFAADAVSPEGSAPAPASAPAAVPTYDLEGAALMVGEKQTAQVAVGDTVGVRAWEYDEDYEEDIDVPTQNYYALTFLWERSADGKTWQPLEGSVAGAQTITITNDFAGSYIRCTVASGSSKVTTNVSKKIVAKDPVIPTDPTTPTEPETPAKKSVQLVGVEVKTSGFAAEAGATLSAVAQVEGTWGTPQDVSDDADVSYVWQHSDSDKGPWTDIAGATKASFEIPAALAGSYLRVSTTSKNTKASSAYKVLPSDTYALKNVNLSLADDLLVDGATLTAKAYAVQLSGTGAEVTSKPGVSFSWWKSASKDGTYTEIAGQTGSALRLTKDLVGSYIQVKVSSGTSEVSAITKTAIADADSLEMVAAKLDRANFSVAPSDGQGANANELVKAALTKLGVTDVEVRTKSATLAVAAQGAEGGIATDIAHNGEITSFWMDPTTIQGYVSPTLRNIDVTFELSRDGHTFDYMPKRAGRLPWNHAKATNWVAGYADQVALTFAKGESATALRSAFTLPNKVSLPSTGSQSRTLSIAWESSNTKALKISGHDWEDKTATPMASAEPQTVTLTARISPSNVDSEINGVVYEKSFTVVVAADPDAIAAEKRKLEQALIDNFTPEKLLDFHGGAALDASGVTGDIQLPTTRMLGVDGKTFKVEYQSSSEAEAVDGYRTYTYRPLPGESAKPVTLTCTITSKTNPEIQASHSVSATVLPLTEGEIKQARSAMEKAKGYVAKALLTDADGVPQDASHVTTNLHPFAKIWLDGKGNPQAAYSRTAADVAGLGIVPAELDGYDSMGPSGQARLFSSSNTAVLSNETLQVTQPEYDTDVIVKAKLTSEAYARYAERYPSDTRFAGLQNQVVEVPLTIAGAKGKATTVTATMRVFGPTGTAWATKSATLPKGASAAELSEQVFSEAKLTYSAKEAGTAWLLQTIDDPVTHQSLGWNPTTGKYWQLFINGTAASVRADQYILQPGDEVVWYYSAYGEIPPSEKVDASVSIIGVDGKTGAPQTWATQRSYTVKKGATAADLSKQVLRDAGLKASYKGKFDQWYLASISDPQTGKAYAWDEASGKYWQLFINGAVSNVGAGAYTLKPGDTVVWYYSAMGDKLPTDSSSKPENPDKPETPDESGSITEKQRQELAQATTEFHTGSGVAKGAVPTTATGAKWKTLVGGAGAAVSEPLVAGSNLVVVSNKTLSVISTDTGRTTAQMTLDGTISYTSRPAISFGVVYVPLSGGRVEAVRLADMHKLWTSAPTSVADQSSCTVRVLMLGNTRAVVYGTASFGQDMQAASGSFVALNAEDGTLLWKHANQTSGYYWTGAAQLGKYLVVGDQAGIVSILDEAGHELARKNLGAPISADIVTYGKDQALVVTRDGALHKLTIGAGATIKETKVQALAGSVSAPSVSENIAVVTGSGAEQGSSAVAVIDLTTMELLQTITSTNEGKLPAPDAGSYGGGSKAPALIAQVDGATYVYFTINVATDPNATYTSYAAGGNAYVFKLGDARATLLYAPAAGVDASFCDSPLVADATGNLYYLNDSGYLVCLSATSAGNKGNPFDPGSGAGASTDDESITGGSSTKDGGSAAVGGSSGDGGSSSDTEGNQLLKPSGDVVSAPASSGSAASKGDAASSSERLQKGLDTGAKSSAPSEQAGAAERSAGNQDAQKTSERSTARLPIWPFVGIAVGAVLVVAAFVHKKDDAHE